MTDKRDVTADIIKICAIITASPRWVGALLAAEGLIVPPEWQGWWIVVSAVFSAGMALVEGLAFAYVFNAWRVQKDKAADRLLWLAVLSGAVFVIVLAPFIAAQVRSVTLTKMLEADWALWAWSIGVAASTIVIVASVGYAQKKREALPVVTKKAEPRAEPVEAKAETPEVVVKAKKEPEPVKATKPTGSASKFDTALSQIAERASGEFSQSDAQEWTGLKKTSVYSLLNYGVEAGRIQQTGRGQYIYKNGVNQ